MTNSESSRLDRLEQFLTEFTQVTATRFEQSDRRFERFQSQIERSSQSFVQQFEVLQHQIDRSHRSLIEQVGLTQQQIDLNSRAIQELIQTAQQMLAVQTQERAEINAALERIDRVFHYLVRRDGNANER